jgi:hypothetical protein
MLFLLSITIPDLAVFLVHLLYILGHCSEELLAYAPSPLKWRVFLQYDSGRKHESANRRALQ